MTDLFETFIKDQLNRSEYLQQEFHNKDNMLGYVLVWANTGGASGGNAFDDSPIMHHKNQEEVFNAVAKGIATNFKHLLEDIAHARVDIDTFKFAEGARIIATRSVEEFYGNTTNKNLYAVEMSAFLQEQLSPEHFDAFKQALEALKKVHDVEFQKSRLIDEKRELTAALDKFDEVKAREKSQIKQERDKYQALYDNFDQQAETQKKPLVDKLAALDFPVPSKKRKP